MILPKSEGGLGVHTTRNLNIAMLGHIWDMLHNQNKLWVSLLSSKYLGDYRLFQVVEKPRISCVWRAILSALGVLKPGFIVRVGKGEVSLWYDKLMDEELLCNLVPFVHISDTAL